MKNWIIALFAVSLLAACGSPTETANNPKPSADPDAEVTGKADRLSNRYTTIAGELKMDGIVKNEIDFPDWFHGYTIEMTVGQEVQFTTWADKKGIVRLYGPSHRTNAAGEPKFRRALVKEITQARGDRENNAFIYEPVEDGTYMVLYGPIYEWESTYEISAKCLVGCGPTEVAPKELINNPRAYVGDTVKVTGFISPGAVGCTKRACTAQNMCCNTCWSTERLFAADPGDEAYAIDNIALRRDGSDLTCTGNECDRVQSCSVEIGAYVIVAEVVEDTYRTYLDVISLEPIPTPGSCLDDSDCDASAWCRSIDRTGNARECVPFSAESESCGGFAPPQYVNQCATGLDCVYRPFVADAPGTCRNDLTVAELIANPDKWDGVRVNVDGYINNDAPICTQMACSPQDPCCNSCGAAQKLADTQGFARQALELEQDGTTFGCGGDECSIFNSCTVEKPGNFRVVGVFRKGQFGHKIEIETYVSLETL